METTQTAVAAETAMKNDRFVPEFQFDEAKIDLEALLKSGVHFGHLSSRRHPKMKPYVFTTRKNIDILDLEKTVPLLESAAKFLAQVAKSGKPLLVVGMKKQTHDIVREFSGKLGLLFMIDRWVGGTLTNFSCIEKRARYLKDELAKLERGEYKHLTKFELARKNEELERLEKKMGGLKEMREMPGAILIADAKEAGLALREASRMGVPVAAIVDTNADPSLVEYPIPANDDAISSLHAVFSFLGKKVRDAVSGK